MNQFEMIPMSSFFFRDHRGFKKGIHNLAFTTYLMLPTTLYGAVRTAYIRKHSNVPDFVAGRNGECQRICVNSFVKMDGVLSPRSIKKDRA